LPFIEVVFLYISSCSGERLWPAGRLPSHVRAAVRAVQCPAPVNRASHTARAIHSAGLS